MSITIRVPEIEETPLSDDEIAVAIRDGIQPAPGSLRRTPVVIARNHWQPVTQVERSYPARRQRSWGTA